MTEIPWERQRQKPRPWRIRPADEAGAAAGDSLVLDFTESDRLLWPVQGNVILGYSMDTTTWFPTLEPV